MLESNAQRVILILYWSLTTAVGGMAVVLTLFLVVAEAFVQFVQGSAPGSALLAVPLAGALGGGIAGLLQWLALRRIVEGVNGWFLTSILGWAAGFTIGFGLFLWLIPDGVLLTSLLLPAGAAGLVDAAIQWRVLRSFVSGLGWWLAAGATGWMLGMIASLALSAPYRHLLTSTPGLFILVPGGIFGAVLGFQTGFALIVLLSYSISAARRTSREAQDPGRSSH